MLTEEQQEILKMIQRLQSLFEDLVLCGLRTAGPDMLSKLRQMYEEFNRTGAMYLANLLNELIHKLDIDDKTVASAFQKAQTSLKIFERLLTMDVIYHSLVTLQSNNNDH
ncbi:MAG: hypothetical protein HQK77_20940 [Desulfobacterales bacterium]|nr:hypothetical protein [Desulfobacterales bacterium]